MRIKIIIVVSVLLVAAVSAVDAKIIQNLEFFESLDTLESNDQDTLFSIVHDEDLKLDEIKDVKDED